ncbi:MAG: ABC transporter ATP-binding protein [Gammaproteobacteria bacterium]
MAMHDPAAVSLRGVTRHFGAVQAVNGVDLDIGRGELFGLIGRNGAGKSTLFRMMLGLMPVTAGEIRIDGVPVDGRDFRAVRRRVGYLPENVVLYDNLTGRETLRFFARLKGVPSTACDAALERVGLTAAANRRVNGYSKGMRQRLGFAQALLGDPRILFLDEPTTGLDADAIKGFHEVLRGLRDDGVTIVMTSHILAEMQERVDRLAILVAGKVRAQGSVQALREQVDLPLSVQVTVREGCGEKVAAVLQPLALQPLAAQGTLLQANCRRDAKMAVLDALAIVRADVLDIQVREPTLEDVFFGISARGNTAWN